MAKFTVTLGGTVYRTYTVEAEEDEKAMDLAYDMFEDEVPNTINVECYDCIEEDEEEP